MRKLAVELPDRWLLDFKVERLNFYLFRTGAAILVVELLQATDVTLADVLSFHDLFRRAYPPFVKLLQFALNG